MVLHKFPKKEERENKKIIKNKKEEEQEEKKQAMGNFSEANINFSNQNSLVCLSQNLCEFYFY